MTGIVLTQNETFIIGPIAKLLGYLMEGIFFVLDRIGIPNIGLSIFIFTIVIYMLLMPLTIKQQKFSKLSAKMNPELNAIREKYKDKKDNDSVAAMNQETQAVYNKYGVSPTGGCVQLLIQMPILFALYRVIYSMPAYVGKIKDAFFPLVDELIAQKGSAEFLQTFKNASYYTKQFSNELFLNGDTTYIQNTYVDVLNKASSSELLSIGTQYPSLKDHVNSTIALLDRYNNFLGINIANSPSYMVKSAWADKSFLLVLAAFIIPILAAVTQWINTKLMPQQATDTGDQQANNMAASMKTMNYMMPLMSAFFCYSLPAGMGLYWIAGAVVRSIQQIVINKHIDKMDLDEVIKKNVEKRNKKLDKAGVDPNKVNNYASMKTKNISSVANSVSKNDVNTSNRPAPKPGSLAAKANMVKDYNEKNNK